MNMQVFYYLCAVIAFVLLIYLIAKKSDTGKRLFAWISVIAFVLYVLWRGFFTIPTQNIASMVTGITFYLAEITGLFVFIFFIMLIHDYCIECPGLNDKLEESEYKPTVDFFVCTYNEDMKLVMATANAAKVLPYQNKKVYVCDDGHRPKLKELCDKYEIGYISRPTNEHAKAGNINYALSQTKGELFAVLDADFIVKKGFLSRGVKEFEDKNVALVQYPQTFYNKDPFQMLDNSLYNEQELFMRFFEPALSKNNAMIHIGTNAIFRRSAIEDIGGIPTKSITEDMATGILLQNKGYKTLFINEVYALGITPYTVKELAQQRSRWARGTMQIFKNYKPSQMKGLNLKQKMCYYNAYLYWMTSFQKLVFMIAPTIFMVFDVYVVNNDLNEWLLFFIPPMLLVLLCFRLFVPRIRTLTASHIYDSFVAPIHAAAILKEFLKEEKKFKVTKKEIEKEGKFDFKTVKVHILIATWIVIALCIALVKIVLGIGNLWAYLVTIGWSLYNLYGLIYAILSAKNRGILTDADALSIEIHEKISCSKGEYIANHFNYNGFRIIKGDTNSPLDFKVGEVMEFTTEKGTLDVMSRCIEVNNEYAIFSFENLKQDTGVKLSIFYSRILHAAKPVLLCPYMREDA